MFYDKVNSERGMNMKKIMEKYLGVILLYSVIIIGVLSLNARFKYLNELELNQNSNKTIGGLYE